MKMDPSPSPSPLIFMNSQIWVVDGNTFEGEIYVSKESKLPNI